MHRKLSTHTITRELGEALSQKLVNNCIHDLQELEETLSGDDSGLCNIWEEVCVQMQYEESFFWDTYLETIDSFLQAAVDELAPHELDALWLQTEAGDDWDNEDDEERDSYPVFKDDVVSYLREQLLHVATNWTNRHITQYLQRHYGDE